MVRSTPGPSSTKLWIEALSETAIVYMPALSIRTGAVPRFSEIVKPGPTVPVRFGSGPAGEAAVTATSAATATENSVADELHHAGVYGTPAEAVFS